MKIIVLCGIKHSGKSTLGKKVAKEINALFFDIDTVIEEIESMTVRELYKTQGKDAFMQAETRATKAILAELQSKNKGQPALISTGGGICDNEAALETLQNTKPLMIFLDIPKEAAFSRIKNNALKTQSMPAYISDKNPQNEDEEKTIFYSYYEKRKEKYLSFCKKEIQVNTEKNYALSTQKNVEKILSLIAESAFLEYP